MAELPSAAVGSAGGSAGIHPTDPRSLAVLNLRQIGDVLLSTPLFTLLRRRFPRARIVAVVNDFTAPMLEGNPDLDEIWRHVRDRGRPAWTKAGAEWALASRIRGARFEVTLDLTSGDRSAFYSWWSRARTRIAFVPKRKPLGWNERAYTEILPRPAKLLHQVRRHLELLRPLGIVVDPVPPTRLVLSDAERTWGRDQRDAAKPATVLHAHFTSNWLFKCWEDSKAAELLSRVQTELGFTVWLTCGPAPAEVDRARRILAACSPMPRAWVGNITLRQLAGLIGAADGFLGVDTAPMHMAAALGKPIVALFGPTYREVWSPWSDRLTLLGAPCRCLADRRKYCPHSELRDCLRAVTVDEVFEAVRGRIPADPWSAVRGGADVHGKD